MKKTFLIVALACFLVLGAFLAMADASYTINIANIEDIAQGNSKDVDVVITNTGTENLSIELSLSNSDNSEITTSLDSYDPIILLSADPNESETVTLTIETTEDTDLKAYTVNVEGNASYGIPLDPSNLIVSDTSNSFDVYFNYCEIGEIGNDLQITDVDYEDDCGNDACSPGDEILLTIDVENDDEYDVYVKASLIDKEDGKVLDDDKELIDENDFEDDNEQTVELKLDIPSGVEDGDYYIYIKAYRRSHEDDECVQESYTIEIEVKDYDVKMESEDFSFGELAIECSSSFTFSGKIRNIGSEEQDKIKVEYIDSLGNSEYDIIRDLASGDKERFEIKGLMIPTDAEEGTYTASITIYHEYDDGDYESEKDYTKEFIVQGNCFIEKKNVLVTSEQLTRPIEDTEFTLKINLQNIGNVETEYTVTVEGYEAWAELIKIEPASVTLDEGASGYVYVYLKAKEGVEDIQTLKSVVEFGDETEEKIISVNVTPLSEIEGWNIPAEIKDNWVWVIVDAVLIILIIVLIVVLATRRSKRRKKKQTPVEEEVKEEKPKPKKTSKKK